MKPSPQTHGTTNYPSIEAYMLPKVFWVKETNSSPSMPGKKHTPESKWLELENYPSSLHRFLGSTSWGCTADQFDAHFLSHSLSHRHLLLWEERISVFPKFGFFPHCVCLQGNSQPSPIYLPSAPSKNSSWVSVPPPSTSSISNNSSIPCKALAHSPSLSLSRSVEMTKKHLQSTGLNDL